MTTLYLVRHGETEDNVNQIMQGQTQGRLTSNGIVQAQEVRDQLASEPFAAIIASDLKRSVDTAMIIAETIIWPLSRHRCFANATGAVLRGVIFLI